VQQKIQVVQDEIQQLTQTNKGLATRKKELQEIKKSLQESAGLKRSSPRKKTGSRGKARLPDIENLQASDNDPDVTRETDIPFTIADDNPPNFASQFGNEVVNIPTIATRLQTSSFSPFTATQSFNSSTPNWLQSLPRGLSSPISYRDQYFLPAPSISLAQNPDNSIALSAELDPTSDGKVWFSLVQRGISLNLEPNSRFGSRHFAEP